MRFDHRMSPEEQARQRLRAEPVLRLRPDQVDAHVDGLRSLAEVKEVLKVVLRHLVTPPGDGR